MPKDGGDPKPIELHKGIRITITGKGDRVIETETVTYDQIVRWAGLDPAANPFVTYTNAVRPDRGTLTRTSPPLKVQDGTTFTVQGGRNT